MRRNRKVILGAAALLAAAGGGAAIAASGSGSPSEENQAVLDDAANQLGISPGKLGDALKKALSDRVDAAVTAGRLTNAEGDSLKQRINSADFPLFGGFRAGFGHFGFFGDLSAAAEYLGLTEAQLRSQLENGNSLAQVATAQGKSVSGLLDRAVAAGRLTQAQETEMLGGLRDRITNLVNSTPPSGDRFAPPPFGFRRFGRPPI